MINSTSNKQVKRVVSLRSKAKARREEGMYVVEGLRMCRELNPEDVDALYVTENFAGNRDNRKWMERFRPETVSDAGHECYGRYADAPGSAGRGEAEALYHG